MKSALNGINFASCSASSLDAHCFVCLYLKNFDHSDLNPTLTCYQWSHLANYKASRLLTQLTIVLIYRVISGISHYTPISNMISITLHYGL